MTARVEALKAQAEAVTAVTTVEQNNTDAITTQRTQNTGAETTAVYSSGASQNKQNGALPDAAATKIRASCNGQLLIIQGLLSHQLPEPQTTTTFPYGYQPSSKTKQASSHQGLSPARTPRSTLKRKRGVTTGSTDGSPLKPGALPTREEYDEDSQSERASNADNDDAEGAATLGDHAGLDDAGSLTPQKRKRRRRGQRLLEQSLLATREPSPELPLIAEEDDDLLLVDLPAAFLSHSPTPDPDDPHDEASAIYRKLYEPLNRADAFVRALSKFNPAQRRTERLFELAANTAVALRAWQDEYLMIDRLTAPHAPIPRKPATANRQPMSPTLFEDLKEADIYDYVFDPKKVGHQDPISQRIIRDASGRELRQRAQKSRITADSQLLNAANTISEDENGRRRTRKPVSKYDGVELEGRRKRGISNVTDSTEFDTTAKRGRWGGRGRGRGRGRGGRGGANGILGKRIREMREASAVTATSASADDDSASESGMLEGGSRQASLAPSLPESQNDYEDATYQARSQPRKGRPKGSKNLHARSDKGIPKGPRQPKGGVYHAEFVTGSQGSQTDAPPDGVPVDDNSPSKTARAGKPPGPKGPKSEKRSSSMTAWWAKRKAAAAEAKSKLEDRSGVESKSSAKPSDKLETGSAVHVKHEYGHNDAPYYRFHQHSSPVASAAYHASPVSTGPYSQQPGPASYNSAAPSLSAHHQHQRDQQSHQDHEMQHNPPQYQHQQQQPAYQQQPPHQTGPPSSAYGQTAAPPHAASFSNAYSQQSAGTAPQPQETRYYESRPQYHAASPPTYHRGPVPLAPQDNRIFHEYRPRPPSDHREISGHGRVGEQYDAARHADGPRESLMPRSHGQMHQPLQPQQSEAGFYASSAAQPLPPPPPPPMAGRYAASQLAAGPPNPAYPLSNGLPPPLPPVPRAPGGQEGASRYSRNY